MRTRLKLSVLMFLPVIFLYTACTKKSEYQKLVDRELANNVRQDSLFLGISFQMESKDFFVHCWKLNGQGILTNGVGNQIKYDISHEFDQETTLSFYPKFVDGKIFEMPMEFQYRNWAIMNENTSSEKLLGEVKAMFERWYGGSFIKVENKDKTKTVWVKVDGNRRIRIYSNSISTVTVVITDLLNDVMQEQS